MAKVEELPKEPLVLMTGKDGQPRNVPAGMVTMMIDRKGFKRGYKAPKVVKQVTMPQAELDKLKADLLRAQNEQSK